MLRKEAQVNLQRKISSINWNQMYYFSLVATHGSLKSVAEILDLSSSTLSEHISQLEKSLGTNLFHRKGPKLILTETGQNLFLQTKQMFESGQRALSTVAPLKLGSYPISIGMVPGPHIFRAHQMICDFTKNFGPLDMNINQISHNELESGLLQAQLDFGFTDRPSKRKDISSHLVSSSQIRFYSSVQWKDLSLRETLKEIPLLVCQSEASTDAFLEDALRQAEIEPIALIRAEYPSVLLDFCRRGLGVGAFCEDLTEFQDSHLLRAMQNPKDAPKIQSHTYLLWPNASERSEAVMQIRKLLAH